MKNHEIMIKIKNHHIISIFLDIIYSKKENNMKFNI